MPIPNFAGMPEIPTGYELSPVRSYWNLLIPDATTNYFNNGSFETSGLGPDGASVSLTQTNCAMALDNTWQSHGLWSYKVTPSSLPTTSGFVTSSTSYGTGSGLTFGSPTYTFSLDLYSPGGGTFTIEVLLDAISFSTTFVSSGGVDRPYLTFTPGSASIGAASYKFNIKKTAGSLSPYWVDGFQFEQKNYPTFYCDGDQPGCVWIGTPATVLTTAQRLAYNPDGTVSPGRAINFKDLGLDVFSQTNTGLPDPQNLTVARGLLGGARYQRTTSKSHILVLQCSLDASNGTGAPMSVMEKQRELLTTYFAPDALSQNAAPIGLRYQLMDICGRPVGKALDMPCYYLSGLAGNTDNLLLEKISLSFIRYISPALAETLETAQSMTLGSSITTSTAALWLRSAGAAFAGPSPGQTPLDVSTLLAAPGLAKSTYLLMGNHGAYEGITTTGVNVVTGNVLSAALNFPGNTYIGGDWTGVVPNYFGKATFVAASGGAVSLVGSAAPNGIVRAVLNDNAGNIYIAGDFTTVGGISANRFAKYNIAGNTWTAPGTGLNAAGRALAIDQQGNIYIGGDFTTVNGVTSMCLAKYTPSTGVFTVISSSATGSVFCIAVGADNTVYLGGTITLIGGVTVANVAAYNGFNFRALGNGLNGQVNQLALDGFNVLYAAGAFTASGTTLTLASGLAKYLGGIWVSITIKTSNPNVMNTIAALPSATRDTALAVGFTRQASTIYTFEGITTITYAGSAGVRPKIIIRGPGALYQISNLTTGKNLFFNYTLITGEIATLDLTPDNIAFTSNYQGNVIGKLLSNSDIVDFGLNPGSNTISCFMTGTSGASAIELYWKNAHWSFDASAY